ncbi:MAG: hypothetical protein M3X11_25040, partial [Acidobacteriota bacterium]|nr:hypothetical protein [Acidobacteriota bacterium]
MDKNLVNPDSDEIKDKMRRIRTKIYKLRRLGLRPFHAILVFICLAIAAQAQDARKVMEGVYKQDNSRDTTWRARMDVYDKKGAMRSKKFTMRKIGGLGSSKTLIRFTDPAEVRGVGLLSINQGG